MRTSDWITTFRISVKPNEARPDNPTSDVVYRVKDLFTTRNGSWEPSNEPGSIALWARDAYLRPFDAPDVFDDAGGDHHLFARVLDRNGTAVKSENLIRYWSDGFHMLGNPSYQGYVRMTPKQGSGWANQVIFNSFNPERAESGAWCWCPEGAADVVVGGGMPNNMHVSTFAVWQAEARLGGTVPVDGGGAVGSAEQDAIRRQVWAMAGITFSTTSAFADYARRNNLGAPISNEVDIGGVRAQGYALGIVFATIGQFDNVKHFTW